MYRFEFRLFIVSAALMGVLCSCTEQVQPEFADKSEAKIFTATIEQGITKTLINESLAVEWESNDRININGAIYAAAPGVPATSADFSYVDGDDPQPPYRAFYPSSMVNEDSTYTLPSTQKYVAGRFRGPMYAVSDTERLTFSNIFGALCLSLTGTDAVSRIILTTAGESVCGRYEMSDDCKISLKDTCKTVFLECGEAGVQLDTGKPTKFFFFLPPQTYAPGMKVTIIGPDGRQMKMTTGQEVSVERNTLYVFNWEVVLKSNPGQSLLFGKGEKKWSWANDGFEVWGNGGNSGAGALFTWNAVDGKWWGVKTPEELLDQLGHAEGHKETLGIPAASSGAYMVFDKKANVTSYKSDGTPIAASTYSVENYDSSRSSGWALGELDSEEPAVLWPFSINENGKTVTKFDIMYLDPNYMTLVYTKGNGAGSWGEITYWRFKSTDDYESFLAGGGSKKWSWANDGIEVWGNAGNTGVGSNYTWDTVDGKWWGVFDAAELNSQLTHAGGSATGAESNDAYMIFSDDGTITTHSADGSLLYSSTYEVRDWDPTRASSGGWELGKLVTAEPAVLFPFSINEEGKTVTEFDIMYLDAENMTLVNTKGTAAGSGSEITYWRFKAEN